MEEEKKFESVLRFVDVGTWRTREIWSTRMS